MDVKMFLSFLADLVKRFLKPTPKFFRILRNISVILTVIVGLPGFLKESGVVLPDYIEAIANETIGIITLTIFFISQLTVDDKDDLQIK